MQSVLFVCLGNICRSPTAEAVFRVKAKSARLDIEIDSAGTAGWHIGKSPDARAQVEGAKRGYDLKPLRARQVSLDDFTKFDLIVAMDAENLSDLNNLAPNEATAALSKFLDFAPQAGVTDVPDPYYTGGFAPVLDLIEQASDGLIAHLKSI